MWVSLKTEIGPLKNAPGFLWSSMDRLFLGKSRVDQDLLDELEALLFQSDLG